ncbi:MAG: hypothetical protein H7101_10260, partial [Deinococcales bacterium]|nr:hypothetical protein [Chitinophagaceae bacterium]
MKEFKLPDCNHFIGLQKHGFFKKSIYLVLTINDIIIGLQLNNKISLEKSSHLGSLFADIDLAEQRGDEKNPYSYIKKAALKEIEKTNLFSKEIFEINKNNFKIDKVHIEEIVFFGIENKKYVNTGDIVIETKIETKNHPNPNLRIPKRKLTL